MTLKARLADLDGAPLSMTAAQFGKFIAAETGKWGKAIKFAGASRNDPVINVP